MVDSRDSLLMMIVCLLLLIICYGMVIVLQPSESVRELASRTSKRVSQKVSDRVKTLSCSTWRSIYEGVPFQRGTHFTHERCRRHVQ